MAKETFSPIALRLARAGAKLTLGELKEKSGISINQISRYEKGRVIPRDVTVVALADALGIDPVDLYTEGE